MKRVQIRPQTQALILCGRWLRVSRRGLAMGGNCGCNFDTVIESGQLDDLLFEHCIQRFNDRPALHRWLQSHATQGSQRRIDRLLQTLAQDPTALRPADSRAFMQALEVSIASIEEHHG
jgi:hypothetical protein